MYLYSNQRIHLFIFPNNILGKKREGEREREKVDENIQCCIYGLWSMVSGEVEDISSEIDFDSGFLISQHLFRV